MKNSTCPNLKEIQKEKKTNKVTITYREAFKRPKVPILELCGLKP